VEALRLGRIIPTGHMFTLVSTPARLKLVAAQCRRPGNRRPVTPARRQATVNAARGYLHGFPLYRNTRGVSRHRSLCSSAKMPNTSGVRGITRVCAFLGLAQRQLPASHNLVRPFQLKHLPVSGPDRIRNGQEPEEMRRTRGGERGPFLRTGDPLGSFFEWRTSFSASSCGGQSDRRRNCAPP